MKITYASYNSNLEPEKREFFAKVFADRLQKELESKMGTKVEIVCCPERTDVEQSIENGSEVVITECKLRCSKKTQKDDGNIGYGTVKEWASVTGMKRVIMILPPEERPKFGERYDGIMSIISGRKTVELYRRGYYDAIYINDLTGDNLINLIRYGRSEADAKRYYGITDEMLDSLPGAEPKKEPVKAEEKKEEPQPEQDTSESDVLKTLLSGGTDAFFEEENSLEENKEESSEEHTGFNFNVSPETELYDCIVSEEVQEIEVIPQYEMPERICAVEEERIFSDDSTESDEEPGYAVMDTSLKLIQQGKVTGYLQDGTLLIIEVENPPKEAEATRYGVTVVRKGKSRGRVVNGRYQSDVMIFFGYCVKTIMQHAIVIEIPDGDAPDQSINGKECVVTFALLQ